MITIFSLFLCMDDHHLRWITKFPNESLHGRVFEKWRCISFPPHSLLMHGIYVVLTSVGLIHRVCPGMNSNTCTMVGWTLTLPIEPYLAHATVRWQPPLKLPIQISIPKVSCLRVNPIHTWATTFTYVLVYIGF